MAAYRMTPARRAALEKAQAASARKRRKLANRSRTSRLTSRKTLALVAISGVAVHNMSKIESVDEAIVNRHVEMAEFQHQRLNSFRARVFPTTALTNLPFDADAARREALRILSKNKKKKKRT